VTIGMIDYVQRRHVDGLTEPQEPSVRGARVRSPKNV
jgi:hypothetical protein